VKKFLLLFVGRADQPAADDAQSQEYNRKWVEWMATLARQGRMESGLPLEPNGKVVKQDSVTDLQLKTEDTGGYMIVSAASLDEAVEIAKQAPLTSRLGARRSSGLLLRWTCSVGLRRLLAASSPAPAQCGGAGPGSRRSSVRRLEGAVPCLRYPPLQLFGTESLQRLDLVPDQCQLDVRPDRLLHLVCQ
jgi:hypothetical protein